MPSAVPVPSPASKRPRRFRCPGRGFAHHWDILTPDGPKAQGLCRYCGRRKWFANSSEDGLNPQVWIQEETSFEDLRDDEAKAEEIDD